MRERNVERVKKWGLWELDVRWLADKQGLRSSAGSPVGKKSRARDGSSNSLWRFRRKGCPPEDQETWWGETDWKQKEKCLYFAPYHRLISHSIEDCWAFKDWLLNELTAGRIIRTSKVPLEAAAHHQGMNSAERSISSQTRSETFLKKKRPLDYIEDWQNLVGPSALVLKKSGERVGALEKDSAPACCRFK